ncbi:MAG: outer envelope protein [Pseudomonadota bacterium]|nr:outer envelope protein [Pseudomonadota bacterium]
MRTRKLDEGATLGRWATVLAAGLLAAVPAHAADWSDTSLSLRYGTKFAEPFDNNADGSRVNIKKAIVGLTHADGYKYGSNFFNVDVLLSDSKDPGNGVAGKPGAQEVYLVYRHTLDLGKVSGQEFKYGLMRGLGLTAGFDLNTKNDGYGSKKRMFVIGPTLMLDVPGFLNLSALLFDESNAPTGIQQRYHYKNHGALEADFGIGIGSLPLAFKGYALYIASKGTNEFGGPTKPETHIDVALTYDVGSVMSMAKNALSIGVEYEYWKNKFGNPSTTPGAGPGATARTPMVRVEYHF